MFYYEKDGQLLCGRAGLPFKQLESPPANAEQAICLFEREPSRARASFALGHPGQLAATEEDVRFLDASRLPEVETDPLFDRLCAAGRLRAVNMRHPRFEELLLQKPHTGKKRVNILAMGDVGSTMLFGLKLLGGDVISSIGICDLSETLAARWEFEMNQVAYPWDYDALPPVEVITPDRLFDCDLFVFIASKGIPPVGSAVKDVRMAQFENNAAIVAHYARQARTVGFKGLWAAVSDPVDPLAQTAFMVSNQDEQGNFDGKGLLPEQIQGYGLGVMNARAAYFAKKDARFAEFLERGRSYGPHGEGLVIANSIEGYDDTLSQELTHLTVTANLKMREMGFKPYVAPAFSSGALSLLLTLRGAWHCGSAFLGGTYMGVKNRYTPMGLETELLPQMPDQLFNRIQSAADHLAQIRYTPS